MFYLPPFFIAFVSMPTALYKNENFFRCFFCVELIAIGFFCYWTRFCGQFFLFAVQPFDTIKERGKKSWFNVYLSINDVWIVTTFDLMFEMGHNFFSSCFDFVRLECWMRLRISVSYSESTNPKSSEKLLANKSPHVGIKQIAMAWGA